jgi:hypothetical protein
MIGGHRYYRKPDPLLLLVAVVALGALMTSVVNAGEVALPGADGSPSLGLLGTDIGARGARLQVSLTPPPAVEASFLNSGASERELNGLSDIFLSLHYPW